VKHPATTQMLRALKGNDGAGQLLASIRDLDRQLQDLEYARQFVPYVLSVGALVRSDEGYHAVAESIASARLGLGAAETKAKTLRRQLRTAAGNRIDSDLLLAVSDHFYEFFFVGQHAGYLLGLAVGQQLAADAFSAHGGAL
jgi:hypothetical protein